MLLRPPPNQPMPARPTASRPSRRRGFSFVEILFAIGVLGIGFIMLAAIFPIGLQQTKLTMDETSAAANARGAVAVLGQISQSLRLYTGIAPVTTANGTYTLPATYAGQFPTAAQLPPGQTVTLPGQVRTFRDSRQFTDANPYPPSVPTMTPTNTQARRNAIWNRVNGELLSQSVDRNGYALLYKRDVIASNVGGTITAVPAKTAQIIVINAQVTNQSAYTTTDYTNTTPPLIYNLEPRPVAVEIQFDAAAGVNTAVFTSAKGPSATPTNTTSFSNSVIYDTAAGVVSGQLGAVAEGCFVVISDDRITAPFRDIGRMNGRIYRVGTARNDLGANTFELVPGFDFSPDPGASGVFHDSPFNDDIVTLGVAGTGPTTTTYNGSSVMTAGPAIAYVLGRGFDNPNITPGSGASNYAGPAQDIAIYTSFVTAQ